MSNVLGLRKCWSDLALYSNSIDQVEKCSGRIGDTEETLCLEEFEKRKERQKISVEVKESTFNLFDFLPDELIMEILSFLPLKELCLTVPLVCKKWKGFAISPTLWQYLDFNETKHLTTKALTSIICTKCPILKRLSLRCRTELSQYEMLAIAKACPLLQQLTLAFCGQINVAIISAFAKHCFNLQDINMEGCDITDDCLAQLTDLPLKKLSVSHCVHLSDDGLKLITSNCNYLKSINFDGIQWITDDAVYVMVENCQTHLEKLWLDGANITDDSVKEITKCINLKVISLSFCDNLSDEVLTWIKQMKKLHTLRLKKGVDFSAKALEKMFFGLHVDLMDNKTGLLHLYLPECSNMDDKAIRALAESCPNLLTLDLSWCWDVSDQGFSHIVLNCSNMQNMIICGMREIVGECLVDLPKLMPHLEYLDASQCNKMSDEILFELVDTVPKITVINYYCEKIQPKSLSKHGY